MKNQIEISISDWIQILAILTSLFIAVISIIQTERSLRQTQKSIRDTSRPYISIYLEAIELASITRFFVIRNFGNSAATITKLEFKNDLDRVNNKRRMSSLIGGMIAPGQKFTSAISKDFKETVTAEIEYVDSQGTKYRETFEIKTGMASDLVWTLHSSSIDSEESRAIKQSTVAILKAIK